MRLRTLYWTRWPLYGPFLVFLILLCLTAFAAAHVLLFQSAQAEGHVTVSIQAPDLVLEDSDFVAPILISQVDNFDAANYVVAVDGVGAGVGEVVMYAQGSSARQTTATHERPCDAVVMAIVDEWEVDGTTKFRK